MYIYLSIYLSIYVYIYIYIHIHRPAAIGGNRAPRVRVETWSWFLRPSTSLDSAWRDDVNTEEVRLCTSRPSMRFLNTRDCLSIRFRNTLDSPSIRSTVHLSVYSDLYLELVLEAVDLLRKRLARRREHRRGPSINLSSINTLSEHTRLSV